MSYRAWVILSLALATVACSSNSSPTSRALPPSESPQSEPLVTLLSPDQKAPPFHDLSRIFDLGIPQEDYDSIRRLYFDSYVAPSLDSRKYDVSATWNQFKRQTERPPLQPGRTGLKSSAARRLVSWFAEMDYFSIGSTKDQVLKVQGTPDEVTELMWRYGSSSVAFADGRVTKWNVMPSSPLKVKLLPSRQAAPTAFGKGSSKDEVFFAQGPPNRFNDQAWEYGGSRVIFAGGRVSAWEEGAGNSLNVREP